MANDALVGVSGVISVESLRPGQAKAGCIARRFNREQPPNLADAGLGVRTVVQRQQLVVENVQRRAVIHCQLVESNGLVQRYVVGAEARRDGREEARGRAVVRYLITDTVVAGPIGKVAPIASAVGVHARIDRSLGGDGDGTQQRADQGIY